MGTRIAIVEDNAQYRAGLSALLSAEPDFEVSVAYGEAPPAIAAVARGERWDLIVMDLGLPEVSGIEAIAQIKAIAPQMPIVAFTVFEEPDRIVDAICAGADGYLLKRTSADELVAQLRAVVAGGSTLTPGVARTVLDLIRHNESHASPCETPAIQLSERERAVLRLLADGFVVKQAAERLEISIDTARTYVRRIYEKLQVRTVAQAVSRALRERLI